VLGQLLFRGKYQFGNLLQALNEVSFLDWGQPAEQYQRAHLAEFVP
jgi:hypothetical protein